MNMKYEYEIYDLDSYRSISFNMDTFRFIERVLWSTTALKMRGFSKFFGAQDHGQSTYPHVRYPHEEIRV